MRSVPHRVVALVGLDDGAFPRHPEPDGDDLLLAEPRVGDREARSEDRQLLLDAVLAATDHLIVTYSGKDERTNRARPPCAPVAELLDVLDSTVRAPDGGLARDRVVVAHPLQAFDRRNFQAGALGYPRPWSFDRVHLAGAEALPRQRPGRPWLDRPLPALAQPVVALEDLVQFVQHPVKAFLRQRLSLYLTDRDVEIADALPLELGPLQKWAIGDRLLEAALAGVPVERAVRVEEHRGLLPPGSIAGAALSEVGADVEQLLQALAELGYGPGPSDSRHVRIPLPDGRLLIGSVPNVRDECVLQCVYSRLAPKHRLAGWVRFLALTADRPDGAVRAVSLGKGRKGRPVSAARLHAPDLAPEERRLWARDRLGGLVRLFDIGMRSPLPLACRTSAAWAEGRRDQLDQPGMLSRVQQEWEAGQFPGEGDDPEHAYVFGRSCPVRALLQEGPTEEERDLGWPAGETTRFGGLARLLWDPLLATEDLAS